MSRRRKVRHSWLLSWYFGLPFAWGDLFAWLQARRDGNATARMIRDMNEAHTVEMPRIEAAPRPGRHALRDGSPTLATTLVGEGT